MELNRSYPQVCFRPFDPQFNTILSFYSTITRQYSVLNEKYQQKAKQILELQQRISELQTTNSQLHRQKQPKKHSILKKRKRSETKDNSFDCPYHQCSKSYASKLALNLHIKIKHKGGTKKERQFCAKQIIQNEIEGKQPPNFNIQFPPNFIQNYKKFLAIKQSLQKP